MIVLGIGRGAGAALSGLFFSPAPRSRATSRVLIPIPSPLSSLGPFQKINSSLGGQEIDARRLSRLAPRLHIDPSRICQSLCAYPQTCLDFFPFHPRPSVRRGAAVFFCLRTLAEAGTRIRVRLCARLHCPPYGKSRRESYPDPPLFNIDTTPRSPWIRARTPTGTVRGSHTTLSPPSPRSTFRMEETNN